MNDIVLDPRLQKDITARLFSFTENGIHHNVYEQEVREQTSIENGDIEGLRNSLAEDPGGAIGVLAEEELRSRKNLGIVVIALAARSAIRGGLSPEISFSMSDAFINEIERYTHVDALDKFIHACEYQYCQMVYDLKKSALSKSPVRNNPHIRKCRDYVITHLHDRLTVEKIAKVLHLNANYLSDLFRKEEGISLSQFVMQEKLKRAVNLLTYSDYTYSDIAAYLGFSSQSHLGVRFKQYTGYTMSQYRSIFQVQTVPEE